MRRTGTVQSCAWRRSARELKNKHQKDKHAAAPGISRGIGRPGRPTVVISIDAALSLNRKDFGRGGMKLLLRNGTAVEQQRSSFVSPKFVRLESERVS
jgi:hypothetical protein